MKKQAIIGLTLCAVVAFGSIGAHASGIEPAAALSSGETVIGTPRITVNGDEVDLGTSGLSPLMFESDGNVMVPLRAVAEKMGYTVGWDSENNAFTAETDKWRVTAYIDSDLYYGVTKFKDAVGMTAPQSYGTAPKLIDGRTFVPAKMFELMGYRYSSAGAFVDFSNSALVDKDGREFSADTLIISVAADAPESEVSELFKANDLEVIYKMKNFNMYTVRLEKAVTADELDKLIAELEKSDVILAANKNYIVQLDD